MTLKQSNSCAISRRRLIQITALSSNMSALAPGEFRLSGVLPTGATGTAQVALPAGRYLVCVDPGTTSFLDPCKWASAIPADVVNGQNTAVLIKLVKGVRLQITITDPKHLLPSDRRPIGPPPAIVGVMFAQGAFLAANCAIVVGTMSCSMPIPAAVPFKTRIINPTI
ncbi:MAG: hypothetical protein M3Z09_05435, partial [Acidobacteriota bacterium]|nr:hypothetical protein [Acidobacteriota bacterium]